MENKFKNASSSKMSPQMNSSDECNGLGGGTNIDNFTMLAKTFHWTNVKERMCAVINCTIVQKPYSIQIITCGVENFTEPFHGLPLSALVFEKHKIGSY